MTDRGWTVLTMIAILFCLVMGEALYATAILFHLTPVPP